MQLTAQSKNPAGLSPLLVEAATNLLIMLATLVCYVALTQLAKTWLVKKGWI